MQVILADVAPAFGYNPADVGTFNNNFRNVVLAHYPAESIYITYTEKGVDGVKALIKKLVKEGVL